jgi:heme-degrading monooxygenase HmoA
LTAALHVVWEFRVRPGSEAEFERRYGPSGDWARLFGRSDGYQGTVLLRDRAAPGRYLLTDTWRDATAYRAFKERYADEYAALDQECAALTEDERCLGEFETP